MTIIERRAEMRQTAIKALLDAEEALTALAMSYELQPNEKTSACHPQTVLSPRPAGFGNCGGSSKIEALRIKQDAGGGTQCEPQPFWENFNPTVFH